MQYLSGRIGSLYSHVVSLSLVLTGDSRTQVVGAPPEGVSKDEGNDNFHHTLARVVEANMVAQRKFVPQPYDGPLTVFRASDPFVEPYQDTQLGWGPVVRGSIEDYIVPGDHSSITVEPSVRILSAQLDQCLKRAQSQA